METTPQNSSQSSDPVPQDTLDASKELRSSQNAARSCWELAVKIFNTKLTNDPKKLIYKFEATATTCSITEVLQAARDAKDKCDKSRSKFKAKMEALLLIVSQYCVNVDIMVQGQPPTIALVWGAIRFLISTAAKEIELSDQLGTAVVSIAKEIGRWEAYLQLYSASPRIHSTIAELFAQVINFSVRAMKLYEMPASFRYLKSSFTLIQGKLQGILADIKDISARLEREAFLASEEGQDGYFDMQNAEVKEQHAFRNESRRFQEQLLDSFPIQKQTLDFVVEIQNLIQSSSILDYDATYGACERVLNWLKPARSFSVSSIEWEEGTCEWIFNDASYKKWEVTQCSSPLWIYGIPGCGKSIMANFLSRNVQTPLVFTHFYRSSTNRSLGIAVSLAASIIAQILEESTIRKSSHFPQFIQHVVPLLDRFSSCDNCSFEQLWSCLEHMFDIIQDFTVLVDALDECYNADSLPMLLKRLGALSSLSNSRVILISRYSTCFETHLSRSIHLSMNEDVISSDIIHFVRKEIDRTPGLENLRENIISKVGADAHGMFLWAKMMMEYLKRAATFGLQRKRLDRFPAGLSAVYEKFIMDTEALLEPCEFVLRKEMFLLLTAAVRPLSASEISTAISLKYTTCPSDDDMLLDPEKQILRLCWPLVTIKDRHVQLIHFSVREFLFSHSKTSTKTTLRVTLESSHRYMAQICLNQLTQPSIASSEAVVSLLQHNVCPETDVLEARKTLIPKVATLYEYACLYWHVHVIASSPDERLAIQVNRFLQGRSFIAWAELLFHLKSGCDMAPVLSVRAALLSWLSLSPPKVRPLIQMNTFFVGSYESALKAPEFSSTDTILHFLLLHRLKTYFNLAAEINDRLYQMTRAIMEGAESILGPRHPFTLRVTTEFGIEKINQLELDEAEALLLQVYLTQSRALGANVYDSFHTLSIYAVAIYQQMNLEESATLQEIASTGLLRTLGSTNKEYVKSQLFLGWSLEAWGRLELALAIYEGIWKQWTTLYSPDNTLAMMAQMGLCTVYRKMRKFEAAVKHGTEVFANRQRVFGEGNWMTIDTALNLVILYRDAGSHDQANAMLDLAISMGGDGQSFPRVCLVERLKACLQIDDGDLENASKTLQILLRRTSEENHSNNRDLLLARLTLADILRSQGKPDEALQYFADLVDPVVESNHSFRVFHEVEDYRQLAIAEVATRYIMNKDIKRAHRILYLNGLRWRRSKDYWIPMGGPFAGI